MNRFKNTHCLGKKIVEKLVKLSGCKCVHNYVQKNRTQGLGFSGTTILAAYILGWAFLKQGSIEVLILKWSHPFGSVQTSSFI